MGTTIFGISKTTIEGVLSFLTTTCLILVGLKSPLIGQTATLWLTLALALLTGWVRFLQGDAPASGTTTPPAVKLAGIVLLILALPVFLGAWACNPSTFERTSFQSLSASKAVIDQAAVDYNARTIPQTASNEALIEKARTAQTAAVDAMLAYEQVKGTAQEAGQQAVVLSALAVIPPLVAQIRALYGAKTATINQPERSVFAWTYPPSHPQLARLNPSPLLS